MNKFTILLIIVVLGAIGIVGFAYSGIYDHRATTQHSSPVRWLLSTTSHASIKRQASDVQVPVLNDPELVKAGINDFDAMCAGCHGAPGKVPVAIGQGLNPPAPDLARSAEHLKPAELFWVTKHGIRMTGMPAWSASHDDDALWPVVAFLTILPGLDAGGYQTMLSEAAGAGHHVAGDEMGEHDHQSPVDAQPSLEEAMHDDGHEHGH